MKPTKYEYRDTKEMREFNHSERSKNIRRKKFKSNTKRVIKNLNKE